MAANTYGKFYNKNEFIISNCFLEELPEKLPPEAFTNPPLKMTVLKCDIDYDPKMGIEEFFSVDTYEEYNHPEFNESYLQALHGGLDGWKMSAVGIGKQTLTIMFSTNPTSAVSRSNKMPSDGIVVGYTIGEVTLLFEMDYEDGLPPVRHIVNFTDRYDHEESQIITFTKMIGMRKLEKKVLHADNFGYPTKNGLYCLVTEY